MSDYGFKTLKNGTNDLKDVAINAKYPIMGFDLSHSPSAYVSFHITDSKTNPIANASNTPGYSAPSLPSVSSLGELPYWFSNGGSDRRWVKGGSNYTYGYVKKEIYRYKHGYNFRPACYGTITGKLNQKLTTNAIGNASGTNPSGKIWYRGTLSNSNYNLMSSFNTTSESATLGSGQLFPYMNGMKTIYGPDARSHRFVYLLAYDEVPTTSQQNDIKSIINFLTNLYFNKTVSGEYPYSFEVDEEYIKIYRTYYWCEIYGRVYFDETFWDDDFYWRIELKDYLRTKMVEQLAGSEIDINIMLFPYQMEDLK